MFQLYLVCSRNLMVKSEAILEAAIVMFTRAFKLLCENDIHN